MGKQYGVFLMSFEEGAKEERIEAKVEELYRIMEKITTEVAYFQTGNGDVVTEVANAFKKYIKAGLDQEGGAV